MKASFQDAYVHWSAHCWKAPGSDGALGAAPGGRHTSTVDFRCFCFSMFSLFSCLLACLLDFLLSRVADEAFYKQPFADVIGYVYVAKLIPFLVLILPFCLELIFLFVTSCFAF